MKIRDILKQDELLSQFSAKEQDWLDKRIKTRKDGKPGVECVVRGLNMDGDYFELKPEEIVRQLYAHRLIEEYGYSKDQLEFEVHVVYAGREVIKDKRIDIAIYSSSDKKKLDIVIEVKRPEVKDVNVVYEGDVSTPRQQMESYCLLKKAQVGVIANGSNLLKFYAAPDFENALVIDRFPHKGEDIKEWIENRRFTIKQLMQSDRLQTETLKDIILAVEQRFGANDSSDKAFEEIFKLIFTKLYDEKLSSDDADAITSQMKYGSKKLVEVDDSAFRVLEFRAKDSESPDDIYIKISKLFEDAKKKWPGVFPADSLLNMQKATVKSCVKELQNVKMFNSNLEVVDDAFEHLVNQNQKEGMGQYFTPRYVIDMCVMMLNPTQDEKMIDTAAGSCGFPMHTIFHVWQRLNPEILNLFTTNKRTQREIDYVQNNVFGIDFSEKSVRVGRMLNIIAGDGHTNVIELNTLDYRNWKKDYLDDRKWDNKYHEGFRRLETLEHKKARGEREYEPYRFFDFDVLMANPPFAGDLNNQEQLDQYELGKNAKGKKQNKVGRDILFIERNLQFLKPGGRMAIVLPQGRFNNSSDKYIREYILKQCRLLAVVGLHGNVFKPHTGTKTSVLLVQKWTDEQCGYPDICPKPKADEDGNIDYPIFFATMQEPSKDNSGKKIYVTENYVSWTSYTYVTEEVYIRKSDGVRITKDEYDTAKRKSNYRVKIETRTMPVEHKNGEQTAFIRDLFIEQYGELDSHRKWIRKNVCFVLKNKKKNPDKAQEISLNEYLLLNIEEQNLYKESPIIGKNENSVISKDEYDSLPAEERKYYLAAEAVNEWSERVKDTNGHIFVKHDLFNHDPALPNKNPHNIYSQNGIAEAFAKFAYDEHLSFAPSEEEIHRIMHPENELPF